jgi:uncharacterized protein (TIRG00374 family)
MRKKLLLVLPFLAGIAILVFLFRLIDVRQALSQIARIGALGSALFILNIGVTFLAPAAGWHLLMRADGIRIPLHRTLLSALMGHAFNLITPLMYVGGEPIRTFYVSSVTGASKRKVLASIIVNKFQELSALVFLMLAGTVVMIATSSLPSTHHVVLAVVVGVVLLSFLVAVLCMFLGNFKPTVKILNLLMRCRVFPEKIDRIKHKAEEMEGLVRDAFTKRWRVFILSQVLTFFSPIAQFLRPTLFYGCLRWAGAPVAFPSLSDMSILFVLSQMVFILPSTPGGIGVYDSGLVGLFVLLGWPEADGGAFAILVRAADLLYIAFGVWLVVHYGMTSLLKPATAKAVVGAVSLDNDEASSPPPPPPPQSPAAGPPAAP